MRFLIWQIDSVQKNKYGLFVSSPVWYFRWSRETFRSRYPRHGCCIPNRCLSLKTFKCCHLGGLFWISLCTRLFLCVRHAPSNALQLGVFACAQTLNLDAQTNLRLTGKCLRSFKSIRDKVTWNYCILQVDFFIYIYAS